MIASLLPAEFKTLDGQTFTMRFATYDDVDEICRFFDSLSLESRRRRFFVAKPHTAPGFVAGMVGAPGAKSTCVVTTESSTGMIVALGQYAGADGGSSAEVAFAVMDRLQHHGLASELLRHLAAIALEAKIDEFTALVLAENHLMLSVFRESGFALTTEWEHGVGTVRLALRPAPVLTAS